MLPLLSQTLLQTTPTILSFTLGLRRNPAPASGGQEVVEVSGCTKIDEVACMWHTSLLATLTTMMTVTPVSPSQIMTTTIAVTAERLGECLLTPGLVQAQNLRTRQLERDTDM